MLIEDLDLEKIAFGDLKNSWEEDTPSENELYRALERFIYSETPENKKKLHDLLKQAKSLKSKYPNDLTPKETVAYRGTQLPTEVYDNILKKIDYNLIKKGGFTKWIEFDYTYKSKSPIQSWSAKLSNAAQYASSPDQEGSFKTYHSNYPTPAIIQVPVDDSFIVSTKITNKISQNLFGVNEHEMIRIDNVPIKGNVKISYFWLKEYSKHFGN